MTAVVTQVSDKKVCQYLERAKLVAEATFPKFKDIKDEAEKIRIVVKLAQLLRVEEVKG